MERTGNASRPRETAATKGAWEAFVLRGQVPTRGVREHVLESWKRCRALGLDPAHKREAVALSRQRLRELLEENKAFIAAAEPVVEMLEISVRGTGFITTLADRDGYVLLVLGDEAILRMAQENFYLPGSCRSEAYSGTNAIGLCLVERRPIQLTGAEHYNVHHQPWTCSSAPILDGHGRLLGAITLSGMSKGRHQHTLALVISAARAIEGRIKERELVGEKESLNNLLNAIFDAITDGVVAMDRDGMVTHINQAARRSLILGRAAAVGKRLDEICRPDPPMSDAIAGKDYFSNREISFFASQPPRRHICSLFPILGRGSEVRGSVLTIHERGKVFRMVQALGGNYARYRFEDIKGRDPHFRKQVELARIAARTNSRVLIVGESGTGKELFAQAIHNYSARREGPFVAISCAAIPRDLIEAELFGYVGGAFTGARREGQVGRFELADGGTLFLDEIDGLPLDLQAKLLRVLQQSEVTRLGDKGPMAVDVRVIAASNKDLFLEVEQRNFREDLYYRLNVVEIRVPPLRERREDLELLMDSILDRQCAELGRQRPQVPAEALEAFKGYHWPGNVRELENCLERALILSNGKDIRMEHLTNRLWERPGAESFQGVSLRDGTRQMIEKALRQSRGNRSLAARTLDISRSTLYRRMARHGLG
jgi:transcriptional regulator of acetoin/glycerol metabolism